MSAAELLLPCAGGLLLLLASAWRLSRARRARTVLRQALVSPDPSVRRAAIRVAGDEGLVRHARVLLELAEREDDPTVRATLAEVVLRNQWEPAGVGSIVRLRLWAHRHAELMAPRVTEVIAPAPTMSAAAGVVDLLVRLVRPSAARRPLGGRGRVARRYPSNGRDRRTAPVAQLARGHVERAPWE